MDTATQIYVIYLLGFFASDYNYMWLICKQLCMNMLNLSMIWQTYDWTLIRVLVSHSVIYAMLLLCTFRLLYNIFYPRKDKPCKKVRLALVLHHLFVSNFSQGFLTRTFRGEYVVPELMIAQIPHWIFRALKEEGTNKEEDYFIMKRLEIISMLFVVFKLAVLASLLARVGNAIVCERCRAEPGCRLKTSTFFISFSECLDFLLRR